MGMGIGKEEVSVAHWGRAHYDSEPAAQTRGLASLALIGPTASPCLLDWAVLCLSHCPLAICS